MNSQHSVESYLQQNSIYKIYQSFLNTKFTETLAKLDKNSDWNEVAKNIKKNDLSQIYDCLIPLAEEGKFHCAYGLAYIGYKTISATSKDNRIFEMQMKYAMRLGWLSLKLRQSDRAIDPLKVGIQISKQIPNNYEDNIKIIKLLANAYRDVGDFEKAISNYQVALELSRKIKDHNSEAIILFMIGKFYCNYLNQIPRGIDYFNQSLSLCKTSGNKLYQAICLDELGQANLDISSIFINDKKKYDRHLKKIITYHNQSLQLADEIHYFPSRSRNLCHLGLTYSKLGKIDIATDYMKKGIKLIESIPKERRGLGIRYGQLGKLYNLQGKMRISIPLIRKALNINKEFNDSKNEAKNLIQLSISYKKLDTYEKSVKLLEQAIELSEKYEFLELEKEANYELGLIYSEIFENYNKALIYFSRSSELLEKILGNLINESIEFKSKSPSKDLVLMYRGLLEKYHMESIKNYKEITATLKRAFSQLEKKDTNVKIAMRTAHKMYSPLNRIMTYFENRFNSLGEIPSLFNNLDSLLNKLSEHKGIPSKTLKLIKDYIQKIKLWAEEEFSNNNFLKENINAVFDMIDQMKNQDTEIGYIPRLYLDEGVDINKIMRILLEGDRKLHSFEVKLELDEDLPILKGNKYKFMQIFEPIIENAIHHSKGNKIKVITKKIHKDFITIDFIDNGVGISEEEIPKIFSPGYTRTDYPTSHQGLGLHIAKTLTNAYNAKIECNSKMGEGTTFSITFPIKRRMDL